MRAERDEMGTPWLVQRQLQLRQRLPADDAVAIRSAARALLRQYNAMRRKHLTAGRVEVLETQALGWRRGG
jgi:hypothetical protein